MRPVRSSEKSIFLEALEIESIEERTAFVESACRGDAALLASVTALLREHERDDNPVDTPIVANRQGRISPYGETESYVAVKYYVTNCRLRSKPVLAVVSDGTRLM